MSAQRLFFPFLVGAVLGGALGVFVLGPSWGGGDRPLADRTTDESGTASRDPLAVGATGSAERDPTLQGAEISNQRFLELTKRNDELEQEKIALEDRVTSLQGDLERLKPKPRDPQAFRFGVPERAPSFDNADWATMAGHVKELSALLADLPEIIARGEQPSQPYVAKIMKQNTPLALFAGAFGGDTNDATPNGAFTHPAVIANLIRASLLANEDPLTAEQEIGLKTLGDAWLQEERRIKASVSPAAPVLKQTVTEVDAKLRFLDSAKNVLTASQRQVLFPPDTVGRLKLDLLSPVLVYVLAQPVESSDRADMEAKLLRAMLAQAGLDDEADLSPYAWVGRQWVDDIPGILTPQAETSMELRFPHVDQVQAKARAQVAAAERILAMGDLTSEQADALRSGRMLLYPFVLQK